MRLFLSLLYIASLRDVSTIWLIYVFHNSIIIIHKSFTTQKRLVFEKKRNVSESEKEIDFTRDVIRLSRPFSKLISRPSNDTPSRRIERPNSYLPTSLRFSLIHYASSFPSIMRVTERMNFFNRNIVFIRYIRTLQENIFSSHPHRRGKFS